MIRITREADYGILLMTCLAQTEGQCLSAAALAQQRRLPVPMVSKILKTLARGGLLISQRGVQGGYSLARPPVEISAADIIGALEGPIAITECTRSDNDDCCTRQANCEVSGHWPRINQAIYNALQGISLLEMSQPDPPQPIHFQPLHRAATAQSTRLPV